MKAEIDWGAKKKAWIKQVQELCAEVKQWAEEEKWAVKETNKQISEDHIGSYEVPALVIQSTQGRIHIDPIGCNIVGAEGRVDIFTFPAMNRMLLVRIGDAWELETDSRVTWPKSWSKETFVDIVKALAAA